MCGPEPRPSVLIGTFPMSYSARKSLSLFGVDTLWDVHGGREDVDGRARQGGEVYGVFERTLVPRVQCRGG